LANDFLHPEISSIGGFSAESIDMPDPDATPMLQKALREIVGFGRKGFYIQVDGLKVFGHAEEIAFERGMLCQPETDPKIALDICLKHGVKGF
jgi:hypothetical protein